MASPPLKPYRGPPMTLGSAAAARLTLMVWCKACGHRREPDPAEQARWYGPETPVPERRRRLVCSQCGSRNVDKVITGKQR
jgi:DNA-directed RNA polymerase subunit RPC12/RpoP